DRLAASPFDKARPLGVIGVRDITERAVTVCSAALAERSDDPRVTFQLARALAHNGDDDRKAAAQRLFVKAASAGYVASMYIVGHTYLYGEGVGRNDLEAVRWFG